MKPTSPPSINKRLPHWLAASTFTVISVYFYAFIEWVFFVTKPSSLSILSFYEKVKVLLVTSGIIAIILLSSLVILSIPAWVIRNPKWQMRLFNLSYIPSTFILSITVLIMFDNFTYTIYEFGIVSTEGILRIVYTLGFIAIFWQTFRYARQTVRTLRKSASYLTYGLLAVSIAGILITRFSNGSQIVENLNPSEALSNRPNIILLGSDGLSARFMSVYGYSHETTPFLNQLAKTSLVAENAFPNASSTTASTTSVLTGKEPVAVNVLRYPDILTGNDSFEHLPGILKQQGYKTVEIGLPYFIDAQKLNLLDGFDTVNSQSAVPSALQVLRGILGNSPSTYFIQTITERAGERLLHIFILRQMQNPLEEVVSPNSRIPDAQRLEQIINLLDQANQPVFVFVHMMNTHGPIFASEDQVFSTGLHTDEEWDQDHYEDAILSFDNQVKKIYDHLSRTGELDNTVLVIYTDHGYKYSINQRIPIMIHFPEHAHSGKRISNVEIIDIPVTLIDYLDLPVPEWMTGQSMLGDEPPAEREIFAIEASPLGKIVPPFNQIYTVQLIVCQQWNALNVQDNMWKSGWIEGHTSPCDKNLLPTKEEARQKILDYLKKHKYDISSLQ